MDRSYALNTWLDTEIRTRLNQKSDLKAVLIFAGQLLIYIACLFGAIANSSIVANIIFSLYLSLVIGQLFIIGHDACHQSLAKSSFLNKVVGRAVFLFALHSYTLWHLEHNIKHHGYTNIKGREPSWTPMTKKEFDQQTKIRQWLERFYRSAFGVGVYYINEMWLKNHISPTSSDSRSEWRKHILDTLLVLTFAIIQPLTIIYIGNFLSSNKSLLEVLLLGWLIPFLSWNWIMGFVIYVQHTHPKIPWFEADERLPFNQAQTHVAPHIIFPEPLNTLLYNIMEHTAHHLQPSIPMYSLHQAQRQLEDVHGKDLVIYRWTLTEYFQITRICKLYDFERKCWTDFDGNPTSASIPNFFNED